MGKVYERNIRKRILDHTEEDWCVIFYIFSEVTTKEIFAVENQMGHSFLSKGKMAKISSFPFERFSAVEIIMTSMNVEKIGSSLSTLMYSFGYFFFVKWCLIFRSHELFYIRSWMTLIQQSPLIVGNWIQVPFSQCTLHLNLDISIHTFLYIWHFFVTDSPFDVCYICVLNLSLFFHNNDFCRQILLIYTYIYVLYTNSFWSFVSLSQLAVSTILS